MADKLTAWELLKGYDGGRGWVLDRYHPATYRIRVYEVRAQPSPAPSCPTPPLKTAVT
jgi:hypothetical protein